MKITSIELHPSGSSEVVVLSFRDPGSQNPYNVKGITGLDAEEIAPRQSHNSNYQLETGYVPPRYDLALLRREPVFRIGLNPNFGDNQSYSDLRDQIYRAISSSRTGLIEVQFKNLEDTVAVVSGLATKVEAPHFERNQEVLLTLKCDDPWLIAPDAISVDVEDLEPISFTIDDDLSTAPHGFSITVNFLDDDIDTFSLHGPGDDWYFSVFQSGGFGEGENLTVSSLYNNKNVYSSFDLSITNKADLIVPGSDWPIIFPGANEFIFDTPESIEIVSFAYYPTYWGV